jgi:hypothetical protein
MESPLTAAKVSCARCQEATAHFLLNVTSIAIHRLHVALTSTRTEMSDGFHGHRSTPSAARPSFPFKIDPDPFNIQSTQSMMPSR